ncbi:MAG: prolyl-tRNA synthetase associated domain-containing protein [Clostridia bacterium]|nr:prolyl-tRNA synthetase associated domain-containing protein [Clostridia bacterium]
MLNISTIKSTPPTDERTLLESSVFQLLEKLQIAYEYVDNDSVESMEACYEIEKILDVAIKKTIVLCNRQKTTFYLLVMPGEKSFNTKDFCSKLGCSRLSFAPPDKMQELMGMIPGSATIMGLLNDNEDAVQLVLDQEILQSEWFGCNPGKNTSHLKFRTSDLMEKIIPAMKHQPVIIDL